MSIEDILTDKSLGHQWQKRSEGKSTMGQKITTYRLQILMKVTQIRSYFRYQKLHICYRFDLRIKSK